MFELNKKILSLTPYTPSDGSYRIRLDANESFVPLSKKLRKELSAAASSLELNRYPDASACALREAFASAYGVDSGSVCVSNGSDEMISIIFSAFLEKDDTVMVTEPDFSMYRFYAAMSGHEVVSSPKNGLKFDLNRLMKAVASKRPRVLILSNPCNPTGQGLTRQALRKLARVTDSVNCLFVLDEAYMDFWSQSMIGEIGNFNNMIILKTCSKALGSAALRVGFSVSSPKLASLLLAAKPPYNVSAFSQAAAQAVLADAKGSRRAVRLIKKSKAELFQTLLAFSSPNFLPVATHTNFVAVLTPQAEMIRASLAEKGIAVRSFDGMLRITAGSAQENEALARAIGEILI